MIDLHTHTLFSDGQLDIAEHIRHAEIAGYRILGIADHASLASLEPIIPVLLAAARYENPLGKLQLVAGIEITHVRPEQITLAANRARELGAQVVIVHGETISEPVLPGTNRAAIEAGVDILAHPGLITPEEAALAAEKNVLLEITAKPAHGLTNGHVMEVARSTGARLIFGSDSHGPGQFPTREFAEKVCRGAGMTRTEITAMFEQAERFARHKLVQSEADASADW